MLRQAHDRSSRKNAALNGFDGNLAPPPDEAGNIGEEGEILSAAFGDNAHDQVVVDFVIGGFENFPAGVFISGAEGMHAARMFVIIALEVLALFLKLLKFFVQDMHVPGSLKIGDRACFRERG